MTADYIAKRCDRGYKFAGILSPASIQGAARTPDQNLARIREVLRPAVSDLAVLFGVSRQAVYDWHRGANPAPDKAARLDELAKAADVFAVEGIAVTPYLLRRPTVRGKSFFEAIREGTSADAAARAVVVLVKREQEQRRALDARLADRARARVDYSDAGAPGLHEVRG